MDFPFLHFASEVGEFVGWKVLFSANVEREISWGEGKGKKGCIFFSLLLLFQDFWSRVAALQQQPVRGERQPAPVSPGKGKPRGGSSPEIPLRHQDQFKVRDDSNHRGWKSQNIPLTICPFTGSSSSWCPLQCLGQQRCLDKASRMCWPARRHGPSPWAWPACPSGGSAPPARRSVMLPTPKTPQGLPLKLDTCGVWG